MSFHVVIDRVLAWVKWPSAILLLALLPATLIALWELAVQIARWPPPIAMFAAGFSVQLALWWRLFRRWRFRWLLTLEHELTHALFAWATLHRVTELRATATRGGRTTLVGDGNWLITVGPYFFPTVSFFLIVVLSLIPLPTFGLGAAFLGASFAYHLTSVLAEARAGQSDIRKVGRLFCAVFLPTANLIAGGVVVSYAHGGVAGLVRFLVAIWRHAHGYLI